MNARWVVAISLAVLCAACSGGGGGGSTTTPQAAWEKFRHDTSNTGQATGEIAGSLNVKHVPVDVIPIPGGTPSGTPVPTPGAIISSPAIALDGTVYVGSSGGTLAAFNPDLSVKWTRVSCEACPPTQQSLGPILSSPAVYTLNSVTSVMIGSSAASGQSGGVFVFQDSGSGQIACTGCFRTTSSASFLSSPTFTINTTNPEPSDRTLAAVFLGSDAGIFYAINADGSQRWRFPRSGTIAAITSSAAVGAGGTLYFTAADNNLYALTLTDGSLKWSVPVATASALFGASPLTSTLIYLATVDGNVLGINPSDGSVAFEASPLPRDVILAALAFGSQATPGATEVPTPVATPTPPVSVFAVTRSGQVVVVPVAGPGAIVLPTPSSPITAPVTSSPALSSDGFLVFGASDGKLYAVSTATGDPPNGSWPLQLTSGSPFGIRSSPSIADDGTIYVGADDGNLYAVSP